MLKKIKQLFHRRTAENVVILGVDYPEYNLAQKLEATGRYKVLFYIDENPWNYGTRLGAGVVRSLPDLKRLCEKHEVQKVFYFDESWLQETEHLDLPLQHLVSNQEDLEQQPQE